jgi:hypothetical protein
VLQRQLQPNPDQAVEWPGARSLSSKAAPPVIYTPGSIEAAWSNITSHVCEAARRQASSHEVHHWLQFAKTSHGPTPRSPGPEEAAVLSHLTDVSSGCTEPIEPLTGTTATQLLVTSAVSSDRRRTSRRSMWTTLASWSFRITAASATALAACLLVEEVPLPPPHRYLHHGDFCLTLVALSTEWTGSIRRAALKKARELNITVEAAEAKIKRTQQRKILSAQSALGPSIPLFRELYRQNCIEFDHVWGWEAQRMPGWWERVPTEDRQKITFYNDPVNMSDSSALGVLRREARPEDFVVLKLDIDTPWLEEKIINEILSRPEDAALIDELFFEFHVIVDDLRVRRPHERDRDTPRHALEVMTKLRQRGIRAHFWTWPHRPVTAGCVLTAEPLRPERCFHALLKHCLQYTTYGLSGCETVSNFVFIPQFTKHFFDDTPLLITESILRIRKKNLSTS